MELWRHLFCFTAKERENNKYYELYADIYVVAAKIYVDVNKYVFSYVFVFRYIK